MEDPRACIVVLVAASLVGCDTKSDAGLDALAFECSGCPADPYRSAVANCDLQNGVETLPVETFDNHAGPTGYIAAQDLYTYQDGTSVLATENAQHLALVLGGTAASGFEPPAVRSFPCDVPDDGGYHPGALHIFGGPFLSWGGGFGISMAKLNGRDPQTGNADLSPSADPRATKNGCCVNTPARPCQVSLDPRYAAVCPPVDAEFAVFVAALDVSHYDGVSFWARRGPNSQMGIRVMVGDKYTDDDLDYLAQRQGLATGQPQPKYCRRNRQCDCVNHQSCALASFADLMAAGNSVPASASGHFCGVPQGLNLISSCGSTYPMVCVGANGGTSSCCDTTSCNNPYPAFPCDVFPDGGRFFDGGFLPAGAPGDPQFYGRPCMPYAWPNGAAGSYCYDPKRDPPPAPSTELCGDFWMTTVDLSTTEWKFYAVPFAGLRQQGWAKKSEHLDLHSVSTIRFSWDTGNIDYWLDEVSFYRWKQ